MISYPIENRPHINWKHIDGPLLTCRDGTPHWLTYRERIAMFFGRTTIEALEKRIMRDAAFKPCRTCHFYSCQCKTEVVSLGELTERAQDLSNSDPFSKKQP